MRIIVLFLFLLFFETEAIAQRVPLRRADSFFGLHFDFHANLQDSLIGQSLTEAMIDSLLQAVKPDFIQVDCKGHPGVTSYPTHSLYGTAAPNIYQDPLAIFRKVTATHGVALYVHYSGVWDDAALRKRPDWSVIESSGERSIQKTSVHGAYVDSLLIPQLKEIADYGIDGVWVDGDCWATVPDYSPEALKLFRQETGFQNVPQQRTDPGYFEFIQFARRSFQRYVKRYVDALHNYNPEFQVASNWAYSSLMPEPVNINVDFMSGDLTPMNGVNSALFEARVLAAQSKIYGKPWDLMSWGFNTQYNTGNHGQKSALNLMQEAAEVIAMGGGYQCYFTQNRDASIRPHKIPLMAELSRFVRERQPFTQNSTAVPQIALLYSLTSFHKFNQSVYNNGVAEATRGVLNALLDAQYSVEVMSEHHLSGQMHLYPLIIIPEWTHLDPTFLAELNNYVQHGGRLLIIGSGAVMNFKNQLRFEIQKPAYKTTFWVNHGEQTAVVDDTLLLVNIGLGAQPLGQVFRTDDLRFPLGVSGSLSKVGQGSMAAIYFNMGSSYQKLQSPALRDYLGSVVQQIFPRPKVQVHGSHLVHVALNRLKNNWCINIINSGGSYKTNQIITYDELPPLYNLKVILSMDKKPSRIVQQPENIPLDFSWSLEDGAIIHVPRLAVHSILMVE